MERWKIHSSVEAESEFLAALTRNWSHVYFDLQGFEREFFTQVVGKPSRQA